MTALSENRSQELTVLFMARYGQRPTHFVSAPGRVELGGNHTDHNGGRVLAASVNLDMQAVACPLPDHQFVLYSAERGEHRLDLTTLDKRQAEAHSSSGLIRGICHYLQAAGYAVGGMCVCMDSRVLTGSGLSSSAAFETLIGGLVSALYNDGNIPAITIAKVGQLAENHYFDKPSGLMDQLASAVGGVIAIDFKEEDPAIEAIPFDLEAHGYALVIVDSHSSHANLTPAYAAVPGEMKAMAAQFGQDRLRDVAPADFFAAIPALRKLGNDRAVLRAIHFYEENDRVPVMLDALRQDDLKGYFQLVRDSGQSSNTVLQNTRVEGRYEDQPIPLALALSDYFLQGEGAARIQGGGFAGTIQVYVPLSRIDDYIAFMDGILGAGSCTVVRFRETGVVTATQND